MLRFEHPIRLPAKLQRGGRVTKEDVLAARTQQGEEGVVNPHAVREEPPPVPHEDAGASAGPRSTPFDEELAAVIAEQKQQASGRPTPRRAAPRSL